MAEYIEREVIKKMLENAQIISDGEYSGYCTEDINVDDIPTENVEPVVHGNWIHDRKEHVHCSNCGDGRNIRTQIAWKFCPSCGAKMDEAR